MSKLDYDEHGFEIHRFDTREFMHQQFQDKVASSIEKAIQFLHPKIQNLKVERCPEDGMLNISFDDTGEITKEDMEATLKEIKSWGTKE